MVEKISHEQMQTLRKIACKSGHGELWKQIGADVFKIGAMVYLEGNKIVGLSFGSGEERVKIGKVTSMARILDGNDGGQQASIRAFLECTSNESFEDVNRDRLPSTGGHNVSPHTKGNHSQLVRASLTATASSWSALIRKRIR